MIGVCLFVVLCVAPTVLTAFPSTSGAPQHGVRGVDVSSYQHPGGRSINWRQVARAGYSFAFIKATEGNSYVNRYFQSDWTQAGAAGLLRGAYHFARPAQPVMQSAQRQAAFFARQIKRVSASGSLPPVLDLEATGGLSPSQLRTWTVSFLRRLQTLTGQTPILYTGYFFFRGQAGNPPTSQFPLWLSWYTPRSAPPQVPSVYGGKWTFWQYSSKGQVPGISGRVDVNHFCCSASELRELVEGSGAAVQDTFSNRPARVAKNASPSVQGEVFDNNSRNARPRVQDTFNNNNPPQDTFNNFNSVDGEVFVNNPRPKKSRNAQVFDNVNAPELT